MPSTDTIAAIATAPGPAGIAIVRIAGPESLTLADRLVTLSGPPLREREGGTFAHGFFRTVTNTAVDEVIVLVYRAPHSYTREDAVEIQCHGGRAAAHRVLHEVLTSGARLAEPGEFTRRAFLNGRLDLVQAEAVADLILAASERAASAAVDQLQGHLSDKIFSAYTLLSNATADLEATLDFEADELPPDVLTGIEERLHDVSTKLQALLDTWREGHLLREGARVVIAGSPNVGKSTLFNAIVGIERAIVTNIPGTTRDTIEETIIIDGIPVRIMDTAGMRAPACKIEEAGIDRTHAAMQSADLVILVTDPESSAPEAFGDLHNIEQRRILRVVNKIDQLGEGQSLPDEPEGTVLCSARDVVGIDKLIREISRRLGAVDVPVHAVISERHRSLLDQAQKKLAEASSLLRLDSSMHVPAAGLLRAGLERLGLILGRNYSEDLLDAVFSRFCIGK